MRVSTGFLGGQGVKSLLAGHEAQKKWVRSLGREDLREEGMATHSSILARKTRGQKSLVGYSS